MNNCIFCKIAKKEIKSEIIFEEDDFLVFKDINPQAPIHLLMIPKKHITGLNDVFDEDKDILGKMLVSIKEIAKKMGVSERGFRVVINTGKDSGQAVDHLHIHILGGRRLQWPPG